jgi:translation initiation factor 5B
LKQENIPVVKAGIGSINKTDMISAKANLKINPLDAIIVGFNVSTDEEAASMEGGASAIGVGSRAGTASTNAQAGVKILTDDVIYKLIENLSEFHAEKSREIEKTKLMGLATLCKLKILPQYVFRNQNPAIFGVKIEAGKLVSNQNLINNDNEEIARVKNIQSEKKSVEEATAGMEIAISLPGINFKRQLKNTNTEFLYSELSESQFRKFKKNKDLLSQGEVQLLQEIAEIKRKKKADWGI